MKIKPALTAEEWEGVPETRWTVNGRNFWIISSDQDRPRGDYRLSIGAEREETGWAAHGLPDGKQQKVAALALYDQPFGFTREDVRILRVAAEAYEEDPFYFRDLEPTEDVDESPVPGMYRALADRIASLLPPEK